MKTGINRYIAAALAVLLAIAIFPPKISHSGFDLSSTQIYRTSNYGLYDADYIEPSNRNPVIEKLEADLYDVELSENIKHNIIVPKLLTLDRYNEYAIRDLINHYNYFDSKRDSVRIFFNNLVKSDPTSPTPLILRAKYEERKAFEIDLTYPLLLNKALQLDSTNKEANYLLGEYYYKMFVEAAKNKQYNQKQLYSHKALKHFTKLFELDKKSIEITKYPMTQLSNYLGDKEKAKEYENINIIVIREYFPMSSFIDLPKDWQTNFQIDIILELRQLEFKFQYYLSTLRSFKEPVLTKYASEKQIFRFTYYKSGYREFRGSMVVCIENDGGNISLYWKTGNIIFNDQAFNDVFKCKMITKKEWLVFMSLIEKMKFWQTDNSSVSHGCEDFCPTITLEGVNAYNYQVICRRGFRNSDFRTCCQYLMSLTDLKTQWIY